MLRFGHLKEVTNLGVSNIKRGLAYFQSFIERWLPHRRSILRGVHIRKVTDKWRIQGRSPPPLIFRPNWGLKEDRPPPPHLRVWMTGAPYIKVWTPHWFVPLDYSLSSLGLEANHLIPELSWENGLWADHDLIVVHTW